MPDMMRDNDSSMILCTYYKMTKKMNKQLTEEYKDALDEREKELKTFSEFLNEEIEIDVFKFNNEDVPEDQKKLLKNKIN